VRKGIFPLSWTAFAWSWSKMIRMLKDDFDILTQIFRYVFASVFLFIVGLVVSRRKLLGAVSNLKVFLIPAAIITANQIFLTAGIFMTS
jgi:hypothetical protein